MPADEYLLDGLQLFLGKCGALVGEIFTDGLNHAIRRLPSVKKDATALPKIVSDRLSVYYVFAYSFSCSITNNKMFTIGQVEDMEA